MLTQWLGDWAAWIDVVFTVAVIVFAVMASRRLVSLERDVMALRRCIQGMSLRIDLLTEARLPKASEVVEDEIPW